MKKEELMVGDHVLARGKNVRIGGMHATDGWVDVIDNDEIHFYSVAQIEPIPLTSDILNANFPDTRHNLYWCWDDKKSSDTGEIWFEVRVEDEDNEVRMSLRYVHELQHALRLFNINKKITL